MMIVTELRCIVCGMPTHLAVTYCGTDSVKHHIRCEERYSCCMLQLHRQVAAPTCLWRWNRVFRNLGI